MLRFLRGLGFFVLSMVVGEVVKRLLTSRMGDATMNKLGQPHLATDKGAAAASREAKRAVGLVKQVTTPKSAMAQPIVPETGQPGWVSLARDSAEMLLAAGAVLKVAADFAGEDKRLQKRVDAAKSR